MTSVRPSIRALAGFWFGIFPLLLVCADPGAATNAATRFYRLAVRQK
jgi:hypothetical protein